MKVKFKDLLQKSSEDLAKDLLQEKKNVWRMGMGIGKDETPVHHVKKARRMVARIKTALNQQGQTKREKK